MKYFIEYLIQKSAFFYNPHHRHPARRRRSLSIDSSGFILEEKTLLSIYAISSNQWAYKERITFSIAPDGVYWYHGTNAIQSSLATMLGPQWQTTIAQAFDTWSRVADVDIAQVKDLGGQGDYGAISQRAPNFGDIRLGAYPFHEPTLHTLAETSSPPPNGWTMAGDVQLNLDANWPSAGAYDFQTVLLHEIGHSLGLDHPTESSSIMYAVYQGLRRQLAAGDIQGIQEIYGVRQDDSLTLAGQGLGMDSAIVIPTPQLGTATATISNVELASAGAADYYKITVPSGFTGNTLNISVSAAGLSMLAPRVDLLNASGQILSQITTTGNWGGNAQLNLGQVSPGQTFMFRVQASDSGRFDIGGYQVNIGYSGGTVPMPPPATPPTPAPSPPLPPAPPVTTPPTTGTTTDVPTPPSSPITTTPVVTNPVPVVAPAAQNSRIAIQRIKLNLLLRRRLKPFTRLANTARRASRAGAQ